MYYTSITNYDTVMWWTIRCIILPIIMHSIAMNIHDIGHYNIVRSASLTHILLCMCSTIFIVPIKTYQLLHQHHHAYTGTVKDPENISSPFLKYFVFVCQPLAIVVSNLIYAPSIMIHTIQRSWKCVLIDFLLTICGIWCRFTVFGAEEICWYYFMLAMSFGPHPVNARSIREHDLAIRYGQPTMSSYSTMYKIMTSNACQHVEHHDFKNIPHSRMDELNKLAPEFYQELYATHTCYQEVFRIPSKQDFVW